MTELTALLDELQNIHDGDAWHGPSLHQILTNITAAQAAAHPIPGAHSIWELVLHVAAWEDCFTRRLQGEELTEPKAGDFPAIPDTSEAAWQKAQAAFDQTHAELLQLVGTLTAAQLDQPVLGNKYTVRYLVRGIVRHHVYHAGQIALLKRSLH